MSSKQSSADHGTSLSSGHKSAHESGGHGGHGGAHKAGIAALTMGALGVVFGDIGTSPLYALRETFEGHELDVNKATVYGACSLVFWAMLIVITIKYLVFVMRANNRGEGGILALMSLIAPPSGFRAGRNRKALVILGLLGCGLLYGDGVITPAISVLSAVEGFEVATPVFKSWVIPVALVILVGLFSVQFRGTGGIGKIFGPVISVWFAVIAFLGVISLSKNPEILKSINPIYAVRFFQKTGINGFLSLGSIFLVVTGGEALYADMGHFGRKPITLGWAGIVAPALLLNYWGQGALLLRNNEAIKNPFYLLGPKWSVAPLAVLATLATVIASQALISGAFSMTAQAVQMDFFPRVDIRHTSAEHSGQIYIPIVNWLLMAACLVTVVAFRTSGHLAAAYGIAVTSTMAITTVIFSAVAWKRWNWPLWKVLLVGSPLFAIDMAFLAANIPKIPAGGWFPLGVGASQLLMMSTWKKGRELVNARIKRGERPIGEFIADATQKGVTRVPGVAIFMFKDPLAAPPAMIANVRHNRVLHKTVLLVAIQTADVPHLDEADRVLVTDVGNGVHQVIVYHGFMEKPNVQELMTQVAGQLGFDIDEVTYFLGSETVLSAAGDGMPQWREKLFATQNLTASSAARFFQLPPDRVCEVGSHVEI
jgi:KUP system potassium uptake protein